MTPREKLIENIIDIVHATHGTPNDEKMAIFVRLLAVTLKTHYAIGRWVSVDERLPQYNELGVWEGYCRQSNNIKSIEAGQWDEGMMKYCTHWLDMSLSEEGK